MRSLLFPAVADKDLEAPDLDVVRVCKLTNGQWTQHPKRFRASELRDLEAIAERWGGGTYELEACKVLGDEEGGETDMVLQVRKYKLGGSFNLPFPEGCEESLLEPSPQRRLGVAVAQRSEVQPVPDQNNGFLSLLPLLLGQQKEQMTLMMHLMNESRQAAQTHQNQMMQLMLGMLDASKSNASSMLASQGEMFSKTLETMKQTQAVAGSGSSEESFKNGMELAFSIADGHKESTTVDKIIEGAQMFVAQKNASNGVAA